MRNHFIYIVHLIVISCVSSVQAGAYDDFFRAVRSDDSATVQKLLQRGFDPNAAEEGGQTALTLAAREGALRVSTLLLAHPGLKVDAKNAAGETALMMAALKGHMDLASRLIERGAAVHQDGWSPLHYAATGTEPAVVMLLLNRGAPVDARSPNHTTPLMMAAQYGTEQSVTQLLQHRADAKLRNQHGLSAADFARLGGREKLAQRLDALQR